MMKKITCDQYREICNCRSKKNIWQSLMNYYLVLDGHRCFLRVEMPWWFYIIGFIPIHVGEFLWCVWTYGIKNFEIQSRIIENTSYDEDFAIYGRAKEIWEKA